MQVPLITTRDIPPCHTHLPPAHPAAAVVEEIDSRPGEEGVGPESWVEVAAPVVVVVGGDMATMETMPVVMETTVVTGAVVTQVVVVVVVV